MYLVGAAHPNKSESRRSLERFLTHGEKLVTDAEVLQEILHRYAAIKRLEAIQPAFDVLLEIVDEVFPVNLAAVERAKGVLLETTSLSARDALHIAVMEANDVDRIMTFDTGFDGYSRIKRVFG